MTIEEERAIDYFGVSKRDGTKILTISDHLEWADCEYHSMLIHNKINYYLEYIYAGKLHETVPASGGGGIRIQLIMKHTPTEPATAMLEEIEAKIEKLGFEFDYSVYNEE